MKPAALAVATLAACGGRAPGAVTIALDTRPGLSDLSRGEDGALWAETERDLTAYRITLDGDRAEVTGFPIDGIPDGLDIEAFQAEPDGSFVLGTEGHSSADAAVWRGTLADGRITATLARRLDGRATVGDNNGIEGLCGPPDALVVGVEQPLVEDGRRVAQIVVLDLDGDPARDRYTHIGLTSDTGKISALDCKDGGDVLAIERHFGVSRLVHFAVGDRDMTLVKDITELAAGKNYEGVVRLPDRRLALVNDNQYRGLDGPSQLLILAAPASP